jgi:hypothetical protein
MAGPHRQAASAMTGVRERAEQGLIEQFLTQAANTGPVRQRCQTCLAAAEYHLYE